MSDTHNEAKRLLLISNSTLFGSGYLDHAEGEIKDILGSVERVLFFPFAIQDRDAYTTRARKRLRRWVTALIRFMTLLIH